MEFELHDTAVMKKKHPCGSFQWEIIRVGADIKLKCQGCGRIVMMERREFIKRAKKILPNVTEESKSEA
ncbi:DUF951 domain-containing protein [Clostridia bacterium OttesenSCG-928-F22]|nr:DUF951 domain-containing protein [Clostridia bacterium OttesenSCG-928-F22]